MPAIAMPGEENAWLFWLVPALERGTDQKSDARAPRTAVPRWSVVLALKNDEQKKEVFLRIC